MGAYPRSSGQTLAARRKCSRAISAGQGRMSAASQPREFRLASRRGADSTTITVNLFQGLGGLHRVVWEEVAYTSSLVCILVCPR
jgi:hypothetical protein